MEKISETNQFNELIQNEPILLVYFSRLWCGVCHALYPQVQELMKSYPSVKLIEVNVDETPEVGSQNTIFSVPAILLFYQGKEMMRQAGYLKLDQLDALLNKMVENNLIERGDVI